MSFGDDKNPFSDQPNPYASPSPGQPITGQPMMPQQPSGEAVAKQKVAVPAIVLMVLVPMAFGLFCFDIFGRSIAISTGEIAFIEQQDEAQRQGAMVGNYIGLGVDVIGLFVQLFVAFGAWQMFTLRNHKLALAACGLSCVPCITACCILGIPFGVWGLVVLNDPVVKGAFKG